MGRMGGQRLRNALTVVASILLVSTTAYGDEAVTRRIAKHGKVGSGDANRISSIVTTRMKRAADMTNTNDPLRVAVSQALFGQAVPADQMGAAKVRLRLYAGLNEWALDNIFSPKPGLISSCMSAFGLASKDCEALVAAAARSSRADAAKRAGGGMAPSRQPQPRYAPQPTYAQPAAPSRFGRYDSGFRPQAQPQPAYGYAQPAQPARPTWQPSPAVRPQPVAAPRPVAAPAANPQLAAARKAEYERKRQEYLERKKAEMEARKAKVVATAGGTDRVQRGPATEAEAEAAGVEMAPESKPATPGAKPAKGAVAKAPPSAPPAADEPAVPVEEGPKKPPALDNAFLDGLLGDPLGSKK